MQSNNWDRLTQIITVDRPYCLTVSCSGLYSHIITFQKTQAHTNSYMKHTDWIAGLNLTVLVESLRNKASDQQAVAYYHAVPFPMRLAAGLSPRRHEMSLRSDPVGLAVHKVALVQVLTEYFRLSTSLSATNDVHSIIHLSPTYIQS
jgi:hypothetical protein